MRAHEFMGRAPTSAHRVRLRFAATNVPAEGKGQSTWQAIAAKGLRPNQSRYSGRPRGPAGQHDGQ
jgi:hypothetical protein